ncbi:AAA family ATPase [Bdellovibrionota bacterium FG-1]
MIQRKLSPKINESFFLFGARGTGKSTWLQDRFSEQNCLWLDLLDPDIEDRYLRNPKALESEIELLIEEKNKPDWIIIDEVQKVPRLLDLVHRLIERRGLRFVLSGSSARKLKRGHANLLGGRAAVFSLFPFSGEELGKNFELETALNWGTLPRVHFAHSSSERIRRLRSYCQIYLKEEILVEQLVRNLAPFKGFLEIAAQMNSKRINYEAIARDIGADNKTVQSYFDILEETYLGVRLLPFGPSIRKKQRKAPKFYWFDGGVQRFLAGMIHSPLISGTSAFGEAFEAWVINELVRFNSYHELDYQFSYLETKDDSEIDVILSRGRQHLAIEIKSTLRIDPIEVRKLEQLAADLPDSTKIYYLSRDPSRQKLGQVRCLPWTDIFNEL